MPTLRTKFLHETRAANEQQLVVRAAARPATSSPSLATWIVSFVARLTHRDPRLSAAQSSLNSRAKDVAGSLIRIEMSFYSVSRALTSPGLEGAAASWRAIAEEYRRLLGETRQLAKLASSDVSDFLDNFYPYLRSSLESMATKFRQINVYSTTLKQKRDKAEEITNGLVQVTRDISTFLEDHALTHNDQYSSIKGGAEVAKTGIDGLIEAHILLGRDITTILDNATFPGVITSTTALLPVNVSKDLSRLIEGENHASVERGPSGPAQNSKMNLLDNLINFWRILGADLMAANNVSQANVWFTNPSGAKEYQARIDIVLKVYSMFGAALEGLHKTLADPREVLTHKSNFRVQLLRRSASLG